MSQERMASPEVSSNPTEFQKVARAAADLEQTVTAYRQYSQLQQELKEAKELAAESAGESTSLQLPVAPCLIMNAQVITTRFQ